MGIISRTGDLFYAFRFLKLLVTPFEKTKAFELGIIDKEGKTIKKGAARGTPEEKSAYTVFHRLVFNLKRLIGKAPGGKSLVARYGAALFLIKEHTGMSDGKLLRSLEKALDMPIEDELNENYWYQDQESRLMPGNYVLTEDMASSTTGEIIARINEKVIVDDFKTPIGCVSNINIYKVLHSKTKQEIYVSNRDIKR
jgi:hypothetical protein